MLLSATPEEISMKFLQKMSECLHMLMHFPRILNQDGKITTRILVNKYEKEF